MPHHAPAAIANAFVDLAGQSLPQMKLQKLAYMAHGWNMAINGEPLIDVQPEAWDNGPVYRDIWNRIRDLRLSPTGKVRDYDGSVPAADLNPREREVIDHVWKKYGGFSAQDLSDMTHMPGTPWTDAYYWDGRNAPIKNGKIAAHYLALAKAGRAAG